jgi:hypothetical protein
MTQKQPKTTITDVVPSYEGSHMQRYEQKAYELRQNKEVYFTPKELLIHLLKQNDISFTQFSCKLGYRSDYFESNIVNSSSGDGRKCPFPKPFAEKIGLLTGTDPEYWRNEDLIPSTMLGIFTIDMSKAPPQAPRSAFYAAYKKQEKDSRNTERL